ncbi:MAG: hypothetical protein ACK5N4_01610 [Parabacteroides gordonii]|uniref:hypothetical protein n=1 Tax=Parabacteroides gordonii TaxID=574930 RepID=UPI003A88761B
MNIKNLLHIFAAGAFLFASCTEENEVVGGTTTGGTDTGDGTDRQEVFLSLKNSLILQKPETKAAGDPIATEEENYIHSLDVYVFGSKTEDGDYTLQEIHYYRDDASTVTIPGVNAYSFNLNNTDDNAVTTGLLKINKGLFVKLYCVANRTEMYTTAGDGTTTQYTDFKSLTQTAPGQDDNQLTAGTPKEADFKKLHIKLIDPLAADPTDNDVLASPLPMSGAYTVPLDLTDFGSSARTQISFKLSRMVARFDIVNNATKSKFTLEKISMGNGQKGAKFFPIETVGKSNADLISYPERLVPAETQQKNDDLAGTTDLTKGAFYTYPSPKDDHGYLMLKGKYAVNQTESKDVSYQVPFQQMINGVGTYIEVSNNHRYTITITKADTYHLDVNLKVADWDDKETIDPYEPENEFDRTTNVVLDAANSTGSYVLDNGQISVLPDAASKFAFKMGSNTNLTNEVIYKSEAAPKWVVMDGSPAVTKASSQETTYSFVVDETVLNAAVAAGTKLEDVTIRLTNPASGSRKDIKVIATQGPTVTWVNEEGNYNTFDPAKLTAYIYNVANQSIKLQVDAETRLTDPADPESATTTGSTAAVAGGITWVTASANVAEASGNYTLTTDGTGSASDEGTVDFTSTASTAKTTVKVVLKDPAMKAPATGDFRSNRNDNKFDLTAGTGSIPQVSLVGVAGNEFTLSVTSPEGVKVAKTGGDWLTITESTVGNNGKKVTTITGSISDATGMQAAAKADGKFTITNKLDASEAIAVEVVTTIPTAATVNKSVNDHGLSTFAGTVATLYNAANQSITLATDVATTLTAKDANFLTLVGGLGTEHTITLQAAQSLPLGATPTLTFTTADGATKEITVALTDAAITALTGVTAGIGTNNFTAAADGNNAKVVMTEATDKSSFTMSVASKEGITIGETSSWLKVTAAPATGSAGSYTTVVTVAIADGTDLTQALTGGKIVLVNKIPDGGDMTIDMETTVPAPAP